MIINLLWLYILYKLINLYILCKEINMENN
jgi:hypothetical protein